MAKEVLRHETGPSVVMNCAVRPDVRRTLLVAGQESHCQLYLLNPKFVKDTEGGDVLMKDQQKEENDEVVVVRNRKQQKSSKKNQQNGGSSVQAVERFTFQVKPGDSIQTDFAEPESLQRVVRISPNGEMMATGGLDGYIRVWNFPRMTKLTEIKGHSREVDDLDFSTDSKLLCSIAKDGLAVIWNLESGNERIKLTWTPPANLKYLFKRCRFACIEGRQERFRLFTLSNPLGKSGKARGFLQQWNVETGKLSGIVEIDESLSALAVREDGRFVAVGSMFTGSVSVYIAFSLQRVLHIPHAHSMFVTGLVFLPVSDIDGPAITSNAEAAVISISVDNKVCIHALKHRREFLTFQSNTTFKSLTIIFVCFF